jgi:hypothetical protein
MLDVLDTTKLREHLAAAEAAAEYQARVAAWLREGLQLAEGAPAAGALPEPVAVPAPPQAVPKPERAAAPEPAREERPAPVRSLAGAEGLSLKQDLVLRAVNALGECTKAQIAARVEFTPDEQIKVLVRRGLIRAEGATKARRFYPAHERGTHRATTAAPATVKKENEGILRVRVLEQIRRDQEALTTEQLAQAVRHLTDDGKVRVMPGGLLRALTEQELRQQRRRAA